MKGFRRIIRATYIHTYILYSRYTSIIIRKTDNNNIKKKLIIIIRKTLCGESSLPAMEKYTVLEE
jgi:hypothetical protein